MSGQILTVAGAMFMIPLVLMLGIGVPGDIPGRVLILRRMVHGLQHDSRSHRRVRGNERGALTALVSRQQSAPEYVPTSHKTAGTNPAVL